MKQIPLLLGFTLAVAACQAVSSAEEQTCRPTYIVLAEETLVVRFDPMWEVDFNAVLLGCEEKIRLVDESKLKLLRERFEELAHEKHFNLYARGDDLDFRQELCGELNKVLGEDVVTDIYFHELSMTEYRPEGPWVEGEDEASEPSSDGSS